MRYVFQRVQDCIGPLGVVFSYCSNSNFFYQLYYSYNKLNIYNVKFVTDMKLCSLVEVQTSRKRNILAASLEGTFTLKI
jgi:hypothetical protein